MNHKLENIPVLPFGELIPQMIRKMGSYGNLPGQPVPITEYYTALRSKIQRTNEELFSAKNRDEVAIANSKLEVLKNEESKILDKVKIASIEGLLHGIYICLAYLNAQKVVVPSADFAGEVDWERESLRSGDRNYTRLRLVHADRTTPEQLAMIQRRLTRNEEPAEEAHQAETPTSTGAPGRPSSMHIVEVEFDRRAKESLTASTLKKESELLAEWLECTHPKAPNLTPKTIRNRLRDGYNKLKGKIHHK